MKKITLFLFLIHFSFLFAQKEISGKVSDNSGASLPGVNVVEKGTTNGTTTDFDGKFQLGGLKSGDKVVFSFIGQWVQKVVPQAGLLGSLAGIGLALIGLAPRKFGAAKN